MLIKVKVNADSKAEKIFKKSEDAYEIWVRAPAERGLANQAALVLLAKALDQHPGRLRIIRGAQSPHKIIDTGDLPHSTNPP